MLEEEVRGVPAKKSVMERGRKQRKWLWRQKKILDSIVSGDGRREKHSRNVEGVSPGFPQNKSKVVSEVCGGHEFNTSNTVSGLKMARIH